MTSKIQVQFKTIEEANRAEVLATMSPYTVARFDSKTVTVESDDTSATSLVAWFATGFGGEFFKVIA